VYDNVTGSQDTPDYSDTSAYLDYNGWIGGNMGGLEDLWAATSADPANAVFIGECDLYNEGPSVFSLDIDSYNPYDDTWTILNQADNSQNGAYSGMMFGRGHVGDNLLGGGIVALYIDKSSNAGVIFGGFGGDIYPGVEAWDGIGGVYPVQVTDSPIGTAAGLLDDTIIDSEFYVWGGSGDFYDSGGNDVGDTMDVSGNVYGAYIDGQDWGIETIVLGGTYTYSGSPDRLLLDISGGDGSGLVYHGVYGATGSWANGLIDAYTGGGWASLNDVLPDGYMTGVFTGLILGTFNPDNYTWQTAAGGTWVETSQFLSWAATEAGKAKLAQLNIPAVEIGKTNLSYAGPAVNYINGNVSLR